MINEYDRPVKGYKTSEMYDHPATVLYDNFAPSEEVFVETAVEEIPNEEPEIVEIPVEIQETIEETVEEKEGEE